MSVQIVFEFVFMLVIDLTFLLALLIVMMPLGIWRQAAFAVMKRNFAGYFSNPTGYVFLCLFVLLTSFAAFWPHEFFTTNLANFDQLNKFLPYIMLVFIPAITMSVWAEERRQGTDELLLTLPAMDFDIVIGKFFATVLIFTVSLLFSQLSNYGVLLALTGGQLDSLLLFSTYLGYWFMGIAMLAVGMVASFLTNNLTVGFIFGAAFNAPLAFFSNADVILSNSIWIERLFNWSLLQRFEPFGRGLISPSSVFYFLGIVVIGVYLCLVLIGRRHWLGGRDGTSFLWHYLARAFFLIIAVVSVVIVIQYSPLNQLRVDISDSKVSTLSPTTVTILQELATEKPEIGSGKLAPIKIDAYVGSTVPTEYVQTKYDLVNLLREYDVLGGNRIEVNLHQGIEPFSNEAILAEKRYGIRPVGVQSQSRGAIREEEVILGAAISSGRRRIVIPFIPYGASVEYEMTRSINSVASSDRRTLGVIETDALIMGGMVSVPGQDGKPQAVRRPMNRILGEMQKQYDIEYVNAGSPIQLFTESDSESEPHRRFDVLLVVQPSNMSPAELNNLLVAIKSGQPVAIFEDSFPLEENFPVARGSFFPRMLARPTTDKCRIQDLWDTLDIDIDRVVRNLGNNAQTRAEIPYVVWQQAPNPYPREPRLNEPEQLVIHQESSSEGRFNETDDATRGISEVLFQLASNFNSKQNSALNFQELVTTSSAGRILLSDWMQANPEERASFRRESGNSYMVAARIQGAKANEDLKGLATDRTPSKDKINVVYVADIDVLADQFALLHDQPIQNGIHFRMQNTAFVQNVVDSLGGVTTYLDLRNRQQRYSTLRVVEESTESTRQRKYDAMQESVKEFQTENEKLKVGAQELLRPLESDLKAMLEKQKRGESVDVNAMNIKRQTYEQTAREQQQRIENKVEELENRLREEERSIELKAEMEIQEIQRKFKLAAVLIPPIPPLLLGLIVFTRRRLLEREGISKARRLK